MRNQAGSGQLWDSCKVIVAIVIHTETGERCVSSLLQDAGTELPGRRACLQRCRQTGALINGAFCIQFGGHVRTPDHMAGLAFGFQCIGQ